MLKKKLIAVAAMATLFAGAASASAPSVLPQQSSFTIGIQGFVPVICRASVNATQVASQTGQTPLGQLSEFCNSPNGYQVWVDYSPTLANSSIIIDGRTVQLDSSGSALIDSSTTAAITSKDLALNQADGAQGNISIRVVAL
ncbi:hypothetical protein ACO2Q3_19290 [Caulobacter sp. KR2-114]|uniref:hypothetical protein n=1 Tax=Caulobacter sp. KR2-114 TaxID=3400912 RepID=UPI003C0B8A6B